MTKIVYNACYGGFGLSEAGHARYAELAGFDEQHRWYHRELHRTDPLLAQVVEELGEAANGRFSNLQIRELPEGTLYRIDEYDGYESVMTQDDYDWRVA